MLKSNLDFVEHHAGHVETLHTMRALLLRRAKTSELGLLYEVSIRTHEIKVLPNSFHLGTK